jgi:antitoxin (DNA-binding transcriptional repressor) of toxin-antitoxin stability system
MKTIGVRVLRQHASRVLRLAERGETFQVTDRGRPLALITPLRSGDPMEELRAAGDVSEAQGSVDDLPLPLTIPRAAKRPSKVLARLRAHER